MQAAAPERRAGKASMGGPDWRRHPAQSAWLAVWPRFVMSPTHTNRMHVPQAGPFRTTAAHHCWHDGSNICFAAKHSPRPQGSNTHWAAMAAAKRTTKVASLSKAKPTPAQAAAPASNGGAPAASGFFRREPAAASLSSKADKFSAPELAKRAAANTTKAAGKAARPKPASSTPGAVTGAKKAPAGAASAAAKKAPAGAGVGGAASHAGFFRREPAAASLSSKHNKFGASAASAGAPAPKTSKGTAAPRAAPAQGLGRRAGGPGSPEKLPVAKGLGRRAGAPQ